MASRINILEIENVKLKEDYKKVTKHFGQNKALDEMSTPLPKVCTYLQCVIAMYIIWQIIRLLFYKLIATILCSRSPCQSFPLNNFCCELARTKNYIALKPFKCRKRLEKKRFHRTKRQEDTALYSFSIHLYRGNRSSVRL